MTKPECISLTEHVAVPGCSLLLDYISEEEERILMSNEFHEDNSGWESSVSRRVKHYGFTFNYRTFLLDFMVDTPSIPTICRDLLDKLPVDAIGGSNNDTLNQMTANEYLTGQGIAPHVDTEACFGSLICVLSLNSGIVMTLRDQKSPLKKHIWLPARSMLILNDGSRYSWSHGISARLNDTVNGEQIPRGRRVSLTFRQALLPGEIPHDKLIGTSIEQDHVFRVYDNIAVHWNHTRGKRKVHWHRVKSFIDDLPVGTLLGDIGCGDGKYFGINNGVYSIGSDRSIKLLEVSYDTKHDTFCCDGVKLPLRSNCFDATICIAVLHHFSTIERRIALVRELLRITRVGGEVFIQAWALEQEQEGEKSGCIHRFEEQDVLVPWKLQERFYQTTAKDDKNKAVKVADDVSPEGTCQHVVKEEKQTVYQRYCHVYKEGELVNICSSVPGCKLLESGWDKGNWFVKIVKIDDERLKRIKSVGPSVALPLYAARL